MARCGEYSSQAATVGAGGAVVRLPGAVASTSTEDSLGHLFHDEAPTGGAGSAVVRLPGAVASTSTEDSLGHLFHDEDEDMAEGERTWPNLRRVSWSREERRERAVSEGPMMSVVPRGEAAKACSGQPGPSRRRCHSREERSRLAWIADHFDRYDPDMRRLRKASGSSHFRPMARYFAALEAGRACPALERPGGPSSSPTKDACRRSRQAAWAVQPPARREPCEAPQKPPAGRRSLLSRLASAVRPGLLGSSSSSRASS